MALHFMGVTPGGWDAIRHDVSTYLFLVDCSRRK